MIAAVLTVLGALQHAGHDEQTNLAYFWASIITVLLPIGAFIALGVLFVRGYFRRRQADGGGAPISNAESGMGAALKRMWQGESRSGS
jgi:hypothetical protein